MSPLLWVAAAWAAQDRPQFDPAKELSAIHQQAESYHKELSSFSAGVKFVEGENVREGKLRAKRIKGDRWGRLDFTSAPSDQAPALNVVNKKLTELWPAATEYRRIDYAKRKDVYPIETLLVWQYQPARLKTDFDLKLVRPAGKYSQGDSKTSKTPPKADDPMKDRLKDFGGKDDSEGKTPEKTGPDADVHHLVELTPKESKLRQAIRTILLHVQYKTFTLSEIEMRFAGEGARVLRVGLSHVQTGVEHPDKEILVETREWRERK